MRHHVPLAAVALLAACSPHADGPVASDAWVRLAAVPGRPAAAYFTVHGGQADAALVQVTAVGVPRAELHTSRMTGNGMMAMDAMSQVAVPARTAVRFAPAGNHVMLFDVPASVQPGGTLALTLRFAGGSVVEVPAQVVGAGDAAPR